MCALVLWTSHPFWSTLMTENWYSNREEALVPILIKWEFWSFLRRWESGMYLEGQEWMAYTYHRRHICFHQAKKAQILVSHKNGSSDSEWIEWAVGEICPPNNHKAWEISQKKTSTSSSQACPGASQTALWHSQQTQGSYTQQWTSTLTQTDEVCSKKQQWSA